MARILVVDDEADMRLALSNVLTRSGHKVTEAPEGEAALATIAREPVDLMLLDMRLPGMDGIQILKRVRETRPELPVIMVTGYGSVDSAIEVMRLGASHYLAKPFSNKELVEAVERILHAKRVPVVAGGPAAPEAPEESQPVAPPEPPRAPLLALPGPSAGASSGRPGWALALAAAAVVLAWPVASRWRERGREFSLTYAHPSAIAWAGERLWTADWLSQTLHEQQVEGSEVKILRSIPLQAHVTGLALTKDHLFVSDGWRREIQRRRRDERFSLERAIKSPGGNPSSLFFDGRYLWSADAGEGKIFQHELDDALTVIASFKSPGRAPVALHKDDRYFWSADGETRLLYKHRLDPNLRVLATYLWPSLNEGAPPLSCFAMRGDAVWIGRDGLGKLLEAPLRGFKVQEKTP